MSHQVIIRQTKMALDLLITGAVSRIEDEHPIPNSPECLLQIETLLQQLSSVLNQWREP